MAPPAKTRHLFNEFGRSVFVERGPRILRFGSQCKEIVQHETALSQLHGNRLLLSLGTGETHFT